MNDSFTEWICLAQVVASMAVRSNVLAAAVAASPDGSAMAASPEDLASLRVNQPFKLNNIALKWNRVSHEDPPGNPTTNCVDLTLRDPLPIGVIERSTGMYYTFIEGATTPWSWRHMLAALSPAARDAVLGSNPTFGVVRIHCAPVHGSYDHKRWHVARHVDRPYAINAPVPVWNFSVVRTDGIVVRFHTRYTSNHGEVAV